MKIEKLITIVSEGKSSYDQKKYENYKKKFLVLFL
jgi:hypothetical protein